MGYLLLATTAAVITTQLIMTAVVLKHIKRLYLRITGYKWNNDRDEDFTVPAAFDSRQDTVATRRETKNR
jgi:hypothetical protein